MKKKFLVFSLFIPMLTETNIIRVGPYPGMEDQEIENKTDFQETHSETKGGNCDFSQQIQQTSNIPTTPFLSLNPPFTISNSGQYCVTTNMSIPANTNAIVINTDNVFLDMQNKNITGQANAGVGIVIMGTSRRNITIKDGAFFNMNVGIQMNNGGELIVLENLKFCRINNIGINLLGAVDFVIQNCLISFGVNNQGLSLNQFGTRLSRNGTINNCLFAFNQLNGMSLRGCSNLEITNVNAANNSNSGFNVANCNNIRFASCEAVNNMQNGFIFNNCRNFEFLNINASNNTNAGFNDSNNSNIIFSTCQANNNGQHGFLSNSTNNPSRNNSFMQCIANNNTGVGFWATGNRINLTDCQAKSNTIDGFRLSGNSDTVANCSSMSNLLNGFNITGNQHTYNQCQANGNTQDGFLVSGDNNSLTNCSAANNTQIGFNISGNQHSCEQCQAKQNVTGFQIANNNHCILNCLSKLNVAYGYLMLFNSNECQIRSNTAVSNGLVGFQNNTTMTNRIYSNFSNNNGAPPVPIFNYMGVPNVAISPAPATAINFTTNISN